MWGQTFRTLVGQPSQPSIQRAERRRRSQVPQEAMVRGGDRRGRRGGGDRSQTLRPQRERQCPSTLDGHHLPLRQDPGIERKGLSRHRKLSWSRVNLVFFGQVFVNGEDVSAIVSSPPGSIFRC